VVIGQRIKGVEMNLIRNTHNFEDRVSIKNSVHLPDFLDLMEFTLLLQNKGGT